MPYPKVAVRSTLVLAVSSILFGTASGSPAAASVQAESVCGLYASPSGRNSNPGTIGSPLGTVQALADRLAAGETGCLTHGSFVGNLIVSKDGITIRSLPGVRALLRGYVWIKDSADGVTLAHLDLDGRKAGPITVQVQGDGALLHALDITNRNKINSTNRGSCVLLGIVGAPTFDTTVEGSRIHNCGGGNGGHDHAIYSEFARRAIIRNNYLYDDPGFGISMYPDSQGNLIEHNVIYGNGYERRGNITFSGEVAGAEYNRDYASSNNVVRYNLITHARARYNIDSYFPSNQVLPTGNVVTESCVWKAPWGPITSEGGFSYTKNREVDPLYVDRAHRDFRLQADSPCAGWGPLNAPVDILDTFLTGRPALSTTKHSAKFRFGSTVRGGRFQCKRDSRPYRACTSAKEYRRLGRGWHRFAVRAIDPATGRADRTPAVWRWRIR